MEFKTFPSIDTNFTIDPILFINNELFYSAKSHFSSTNQGLIAT